MYVKWKNVLVDCEVQLFYYDYNIAKDFQKGLHEKEAWLDHNNRWPLVEAFSFKDIHYCQF